MAEKYVRKNEHCGKTPEAEARRMANLRKGSATQGGRRAHKGKGRGNPKLSPLWKLELERVQAVAADQCPWILASDQFELEILAGLLVGVSETRTYLATHGWLDDNGQEQPAVKTFMRVSTKAAEEAQRLGFTPRARVDLGLAVAQTRRVMTEPIRSEEQASAVAGLLQEIGALPKLDEGNVIEGRATPLPTDEPGFYDRPTLVIDNTNGDQK